MKILINGASSGLGRYLSQYYNSKGHNLICIGKNKSKIMSLKREMSSKNLFFSGDLSIDKILIKLKKDLLKIKKIDAVIHCMGGGFGIKDDLLSKKDFFELFNKNLFVQSEINNFIIKKSLKEKNSLKIIHISTVASIENVASVGYSTAKAALNIYSQILSKKLFSKNIDIKNIIMGAFETNDNSFGRLKKKNIRAYKKFKNTRMPLKKYILPNEIVPTLNFLLDKNSRIISGDIVLDNREKSSFRN